MESLKDAVTRARLAFNLPPLYDSRPVACDGKLNSKVAEYLLNFVPIDKCTLGSFLIDNCDYLEEQLNGRAYPGLAKGGMLRIASTEAAENLLLDLPTGRIFVCQTIKFSPVMIKLLDKKEWSREDLVEALSEIAIYVFDSLYIYFLFIEDEGLHPDDG